MMFRWLSVSRLAKRRISDGYHGINPEKIHESTFRLCIIFTIREFVGHAQRFKYIGE